MRPNYTLDSNPEQINADCVSSFVSYRWPPLIDPLQYLFRQLIASAIAQIVAGALAPPSNWASFRDACPVRHKLKPRLV